MLIFMNAYAGRVVEIVISGAIQVRILALRGDATVVWSAIPIVEPYVHCRLFLLRYLSNFQGVPPASLGEWTLNGGGLDWYDGKSLFLLVQNS